LDLLAIDFVVNNNSAKPSDCNVKYAVNNFINKNSFNYQNIV